MLNTGMKIRKRRKELGLKVCELAKQVGCTAVYITQIEKHNKLPSPAVFKKICGLLKLPEDVYAEYLKNKYEEVYSDRTRELPQNTPADSFLIKHTNKLSKSDFSTVAELLLKDKDSKHSFNENEAKNLIKTLKEWHELLNQQDNERTALLNKTTTAINNILKRPSLSRKSLPS